MLLLDALPLTGDDRNKLFEDLRALIARTMREGDRAQLLTWTEASGVRAATPLTRDRSVIERALSGAQRNLHTGAAGVTTEDVDEFFRQGDETSQLTTNAAEQAGATQRFGAEDELARMRRKTAAFQRVVTSLAQPDGRNVLVYVSSFFPLVAGRGFTTGWNKGARAQA